MKGRKKEELTEIGKCSEGSPPVIFLRGWEAGVRKKEVFLKQEREILEGLRRGLENWFSALCIREENMEKREQELKALEAEITRSRGILEETKKGISYAPAEVQILKSRVEALQRENRELLQAKRNLLQQLYDQRGAEHDKGQDGREKRPGNGT